MSATAPATQAVHPTTGGVDARGLIDVLDFPRSSAEPVHSAGLGGDIRLPGFDSPYDDCGDPLPFFCENCGRTMEFGRTCRRSVCQHCAPTWCRDRAISVTARLLALRAVRDANREPHQRFHHIVFSPPWPGWKVDADDPLDRTFHVIRDVLKVMDLEGVVIYHPYSGADGDDIGAWKNRLFEGREWSDVHDDLELRPHFHVIAVGHKVPGGEVTKQVEEETGWIIHRIRKGDSNVSMYGLGDLARVATYDLSHVGIRETDNGNQSAQYRYFGKNLNDIDVFEETKRQADLAVRAVATRTLGLPYESQACVADNQVDEGAHEHVGRVDLSMNASDEDDDGLEADRDDVPGGCATAPMGTRSSRGFNLDTYAGSVGRSNPNELRLGDHIPSTDSSAPPARSPATNLPPPDAPGPRPDTEKCRGRVLGISNAPDYIDDDDWWLAAPYADELYETYDEWRQKLDWLPDDDPLDRPPPD